MTKRDHGAYRAHFLSLSMNSTAYALLLYMPHTPDSDPTVNLTWAGRVWGNLTRLQCAGILHIALRYGERQADTNAYIESMSNLTWPDLGRPLQLDITHALLELQRVFGR